MSFERADAATRGQLPQFQGVVDTSRQGVSSIATQIDTTARFIHWSRSWSSEGSEAATSGHFPHLNRPVVASREGQNAVAAQEHRIDAFLVSLEGTDAAARGRIWLFITSSPWRLNSKCPFVGDRFWSEAFSTALTPAFTPCAKTPCPPSGPTC